MCLSQSIKGHFREDDLIVVTNQFSSSEQENKNGLIKVNVGGYKGDTYIPSNNTYNPNINKKPVTVIDNQTDKIAPNINVSYSKQDITNKNVIVTIKSNETLKGTEGWEVYDNGKTLRKEFNKNIGRTIYTFYDLGGNPVSVDVTISNIDQDKPNDSVINKNIFNTKEFDVVTRISDIGFGLNLEECKYVLSSNEKANFDGATTFKNANETLKLKVEKDGIYYLHTFLKDEVGNEKVTTHKITIDSTKPDLEVSYSNTQITNENVTVTIKANEKIQGIEGWVSSDDETTLTKVFDENDTQTVTIRDIAGNTITRSIVVANII